jgi:hypothetical protein
LAKIPTAAAAATDARAARRQSALKPAPRRPILSGEICIHCHELHPATTAFCPTTGQPLRAAPIAPAAAGPAAGGAGLPPASPLDGGADGGGVPEMGVFDLLQRAFQLYKAHARSFLTIAAVVFVPGALAHACARAAILAPTLAVGVALDPMTHLPTTAPVAGAITAGFGLMLLGLLAAAVTGLFLNGVIIPLAQGALALSTADRMAGGHADWREIWTLLFRRMGIVLSAIIPAALLTGVGFLFLVVPGILLAFFFSFVPTVALFEGVGGTAALRRSYDLVRSDWLRMLLILIAFGIISAVAQTLAGMLWRGLFGTRLLQDALTLLVLPIPVIASVLLYFDIRRKREGFDDKQLAKEMESLRQRS